VRASTASVFTRAAVMALVRNADELLHPVSPRRDAACHRPPGLREADGRDAIEERFRIWTEETRDYEVLEVEAGPFADLLRLRWIVRGVEVDYEEATTFEQVAYAEIADGLLTTMRLACSGDRPIV
jgi:hypothetical protein